MRKLVVIIGLVAAAAALGVGAVSASQSGTDDRQGRAVDDRAAVLLNRARKQVNREHPACRPRISHGRAQIVHGPPEAALLRELAILRRPATAADRAAFKLNRVFADKVYVDYFRVAHSLDGTRFEIVPTRMNTPPAIPRVCIRLWRSRLIRLLKNEPADVRKRALAFDAQLQRDEHPDRPTTSRDGVQMMSNGGGGGGVNASFLRRYGQFTSGGGNRGSEISGLIPDGVARLSASFPRSASRGPNRAPRIYARAVTIRAKVRENVVHFRVPRAPQDAFPSRMVWYAQDGSVVRVVTPPH